MFFRELTRQLLIFQGDTSDDQMVSYIWFKLITCRSLVLIVAYLDIILKKIRSMPSEPASRKEGEYLG